MSALGSDEKPLWPALFERMLAGGRYLSLLNLNDPGDDAVTELGAILRTYGAGLEDDVVRLLDPALAGWRPQLVGAVSVLLLPPSSRTLDAVWRALEQPSWVAPQLAVTAFLMGSDFEQRARKRIEARCRVDASAVREKSLTGPGYPDFNDGKQLRALVALLKAGSALPPWLAALEASDDIQDMLSQPYGEGSELALRWLERIRPCLAA